jgi:DNA polymerase I-like protein with 3'-5' exonuclease and polymerase domains
MTERVYLKVDTSTKVKEMVAHIKEHEYISVDIETDSLNTRKGQIIGFSVTGVKGLGYYLPTMIYANGELLDAKIDGISCHDIAKKILLLLVGKKLIGHNLSFDSRFIKNFYGVNLIDSIYADTLLMVHTIQEEGVNSEYGQGVFALKEVARSIQSEIGIDVETEANQEQIDLKESIKANGGSTSKDNYEIFKANIDILSKYACADTDLALRVYEYYLKKLEEQGLLEFFFEDEVMPLYREVTIPMEDRGVKIDLELIKSSREKITLDMEKYERLVVDDLLERKEVQRWIKNKATEMFPPKNKGSYAQETAKYFNLDLPISETSGKYSITKSTVSKLPPSPVKTFLLEGFEYVLDQEDLDKISISLWKKENDGAFFNIQSKDQMGDIAFNALGIKPLSQTKKGKSQFDEDLIQSIADQHSWASKLRIYGKLLKIKSTYMDRFLDGQENGRYFFYYKQHGTVSGRYGSDAQQLPRPKEEGDDDPIVVEYTNLIRAFFISDTGNVFIDCDYESLEPHVFAHVSGDEGLRDIFRNNWDFYSTIAIKTEGLHQYSPDKKSENFLRKHAPKVRNDAKAYSLGIPYGMGAYALGKTLGVSQKKAQTLVDGYLNGFPALKQWMHDSRTQAQTLGYVKTQVGRVRHLDKVKKIHDIIGEGIMDWQIRNMLSKQYGKDKVTKIYRDYSNGLNNALNVQIQGLSASIVNRAAIAINRELKKRGIDGQVCGQIHDQIITEVPEDRAKECAELVQQLMENTTKISIKLKAPAEIGRNFKDAH